MLKRLITYAGIAAALGVATNVCFTLYFNRDFTYFSKLLRISTKWEQELRESHPHIYIVAGGSSARAGIDPKILLEEANIPLSLAALGAGYGMDGNTAIAHQMLQAGDTLILAIEPGLVSVTSQNTLTPMGARMLLREQGISLYSNPFIRIDWRNALSPFGSDSSGLASHLAKTISRPEGKRYTYDYNTNIHPSGWMEVTKKVNYHVPLAIDSAQQTLHNFTLTDAAKASFARIKDYCDKNRINTIALVPRFYADESARPYTLWFALQLTRMGIPVLYDEKMSVVEDVTHIADTVNHLDANGTRENTLQIADSLRKQHFWTEGELIEELAKRGWSAQGVRLKATQD